MSQVLKYPVPIDDEWHVVPQPLDLDHRAAMKFGQQDDRHVTLWYVPHPELTIRVKVVGTGHEFEGTHIGSVQWPSQFLVWHVIWDSR